MSTTFDPKAYVIELEQLARAGDWMIQYLSACTEGTRPWLQRVAQKGTNPRSLYLSSGIHGDEISGPLAILEMLRQPDFFADFNVTLFPILNPNGLADVKRENRDGIDLNRDYRSPKSDEIASHIEALKTLGRFDGTMMLHEDYEGIGAYLYELNETLPEQLGNQIITAMGQHVPIDMRPEIEEVAAIDGLIQRRDLILKYGAMEDRPDWPEAIYLTLNHTKVSYTTETPMPFPLSQRIQAQIAAVKTLMSALIS